LDKRQKMTSNDKESKSKTLDSDFEVLEVIDITSIPDSEVDRREWIKYALKIRGIKLSDLARKTGITRQCYSQALHRQYPSCEYHIAQALNVKPSDLWPERYKNGLPIKRDGKRNDFENNQTV